jgi:hypothetical protein
MERVAFGQACAFGDEEDHAALAKRVSPEE